jgi:alkanesulfonate monooxygenase SsuD/methylene tetrahydromethanopterin reductase-like flavin-dependent oxidoreductase (luciferase family)
MILGIRSPRWTGSPRAIWSLGVGFAADLPNIRAEFVAAGVPFEHRIGRMMEGLRVYKALWSGQPVDWEGRWQTTQAVVAPTPARCSGSAAIYRAAWTMPASISTAGSPVPPTRPSSPPACRVSATSPGITVAIRPVSAVRCI